MKLSPIRFSDHFKVKHGYAFKSEHFSDEGPYALLTPGNFNETGGFRNRGEKQPYYTGEVPTNYILSKGDVIVAMTEQDYGLLGSSAWVPAAEHYLHNQRLGLITDLDEKVLNKRFLYYLFNTREVRHQIAGSASGTKVRHTSPGRIGLVEAEVPEIKVQDKIADTLTAYDDLIENNRRRMALLEEFARLLYREWFVHHRFPGHEKAKLTNGVPKGWERVPLGAVSSKIGSGATPRGGDAAYQTEGIPLIRSMNVYDDRFDDDGLAFIDEEQAAALANVTVQSRDILLNITGASVCRCCMAPERYVPARVNQHVMIIRTDPAKADPFFVHAAINSDERKRQLLSYAQKGSTREALTKETVSNFEITRPSDALMRQFGESAGDAFRQREILAQQTQKLRNARDLLLPRLISGEVETI